jgi:hypothetical protein
VYVPTQSRGYLPKLSRRAGYGASAAAGTDPGAAFVAIPVAGGGASATPDIRIQFNRGPTSIGVTWPVSAAADCGQWRAR